MKRTPLPAPLSAQQMHDEMGALIKKGGKDGKEDGSEEGSSQIEAFSRGWQ